MWLSINSYPLIHSCRHPFLIHHTLLPGVDRFEWCIKFRCSQCPYYFCCRRGLISDAPWHSNVVAEPFYVTNKNILAVVNTCLFKHHMLCSPSVGVLNPFFSNLQLLNLLLEVSALWQSDFPMLPVLTFWVTWTWLLVLLSALFSNYVDATSFL